MSQDMLVIDLVREEIKELRNHGINLAFGYENIKKSQTSVINAIQSMVTTNETIYSLMQEINAFLIKIGNTINVSDYKITEELDIKTIQEEKKQKSILENAIDNKINNSKDKFLKRPVSDLYFTVRTGNCLKMKKIDTVEKLISYSEKELLKIDGFGKKSLREVIEILNNHGLSLKQD